MANSNADLIHNEGLKFVYLRNEEIVLHKIRDNLFHVKKAKILLFGDISHIMWNTKENFREISQFLQKFLLAAETLTWSLNYDVVK